MALMVFMIFKVSAGHCPEIKENAIVGWLTHCQWRVGRQPGFSSVSFACFPDLAYLCSPFINF